GRHGGGDDVFEPVAGARAAVVAGRPAAVRQPDLGERVTPVLQEEVLVQPGRDMVPGEDFVLVTVAVDVPVEVEAGTGDGVDPEVVAEVLAPLLEDAAPAPDVLDDRAEPAVAPAHEAFDGRRRRV